MWTNNQFANFMIGLVIFAIAYYIVSQINESVANGMAVLVLLGGLIIAAQKGSLKLS